jgi:Repeat of Unknown Function (DUF347)
MKYEKVPAVVLIFWIMKICATTLGETAGDLLSMTLQVGYALSTLILLGIFAAMLAGQLAARRYHPPLYWMTILATSTAGTTWSDFMDRSLGLGYATGAALLATLLVVILLVWRSVEHVGHGAWRFSGRRQWLGFRRRCAAHRQPIGRGCRPYVAHQAIAGCVVLASVCADAAVWRNPWRCVDQNA